MNEVTRILGAIERGDPKASEELLPLVYGELRALAARRMAGERAGHTLQATALVHEAYMRLVGIDGDTGAWHSRGHFFAAAAEAMRRILIERARARGAIKHGGNRRRLRLDPNLLLDEEMDEDLIDLDAALTKFAQEDRAKADLVKLRFFAGLTRDEAASMLGISAATADRHWAYARAWLYDEISRS